MNIYNDLKTINDNKLNKDENYFLFNNELNENDNIIDNIEQKMNLLQIKEHNLYSQKTF